MFHCLFLALGSQWRSFCQALEADNYATDPRFQTAPDRAANMDDFFGTIGELAAKFEATTVVERLRHADVPVAPVLTPDEVRNDEHIQARGFITERDHHIVGKYLSPKPPISMFGDELDLSPAPRLGEHSAEILGELGYSASRISSLSEDGVIRNIET